MRPSVPLRSNPNRDADIGDSFSANLLTIVGSSRANKSGNGPTGAVAKGREQRVYAVGVMGVGARAVAVAVATREGFYGSAEDGLWCERVVVKRQTVSRCGNNLTADDASLRAARAVRAARQD